ncbi:hypothetical protein MD484_g2586, partial [Candolleomyces efflorescens]
MSKLQGLVTKGFIRPNLSNAVLDLNKWVEERQKTVPNFRYYTVGGLAAVLQGDAEKLSIQTQPSWELWSNAKKPNQIKAMIKFGDDPDKVKIDALLVQPSEYSIFTKHKLITSVEGISVANPVLLAITKLETLAVRGNAIKLPNDYADLIWCLKEAKKLGLVIPQEALDIGFPAGWAKMYTRLRKVVDADQVAQLTKLLKDMGINPQVPL